MSRCTAPQARIAPLTPIDRAQPWGHQPAPPAVPLPSRRGTWRGPWQGERHRGCRGCAHFFCGSGTRQLTPGTPTTRTYHSATQYSRRRGQRAFDGRSGATGATAVEQVARERMVTVTSPSCHAKAARPAPPPLDLRIWRLKHRAVNKTGRETRVCGAETYQAARRWRWRRLNGPDTQWICEPKPVIAMPPVEKTATHERSFTDTPRSTENRNEQPTANHGRCSRGQRLTRAAQSVRTKLRRSPHHTTPQVGTLGPARLVLDYRAVVHNHCSHVVGTAAPATHLVGTLHEGGALVRLVGVAGASTAA